MLRILGNGFQHFRDKGQYHIFIDTVLGLSLIHILRRIMQHMKSYQPLQLLEQSQQHFRPEKLVQLLPYVDLRRLAIRHPEDVPLARSQRLRCV